MSGIFKSLLIFTTTTKERKRCSSDKRLFVEFDKSLSSIPETIYVMTITKNYDVATRTSNAGGGANGSPHHTWFHFFDEIPDAVQSETRGIGLHYTKLSTYAQRRA